MPDDSKSLDVLGIKPIADSINLVVAATLDGARAFLSRICLPVAEETGLLFRDIVSGYRTERAVSVLLRAQAKGIPDGAHAQPRIVHEVIDKGSWMDDPIVQDMWGGLLASACTEDGDDDSNMVFIDLLSRLTRLQARILNYAIESSRKRLSRLGLIMSSELKIDHATLFEAAGTKDLNALDCELDHLRELGLIGSAELGGFAPHIESVDITPTSLALYMYIRCKGSRQSPAEFFNVSADGVLRDKGPLSQAFPETL